MSCFIKRLEAFEKFEKWLKWEEQSIDDEDIQFVSVMRREWKKEKKNDEKKMSERDKRWDELDRTKMTRLMNDD
jgi:hypothetical protein